MPLVNEVVALVVVIVCALYLGRKRRFAARNREYLPTVFAFAFICIALVAANLKPHLCKELFEVIKHWALAFTALAIAWQALSLQGLGKKEQQ